MAGYTTIHIGIISDAPATEETLQVGCRVKCIFQFTASHGKTGEVVQIDNRLGTFMVKWDDGSTRDPWWSDPGSFTIITGTPTPTDVATVVAINDHVCPTCKNDRCSRSEKNCWKCGGVL